MSLLKLCEQDTQVQAGVAKTPLLCFGECAETLKRVRLLMCELFSEVFAHALGVFSIAMSAGFCCQLIARNLTSSAGTQAGAMNKVRSNENGLMKLDVEQEMQYLET